MDHAIVDGVFIHFMIRDKVLLRYVLNQVFRMSKPSESSPHGLYGTNKAGKGKKVIIEYSSPNSQQSYDQTVSQDTELMGYRSPNCTPQSPRLCRRC